MISSLNYAKFDLTKTLDMICQNKVYFDNCLNTAEKLVEIKKYELATKYIDVLAKFNWGNVTGYYTSWRLEGLLNRIGESLKDNVKFEKKNNTAKLRILHVTSEIFNSGGHTRLIMNWMKNDAENMHHVVVTRQKKEELPYIVIKEFAIDEAIFSVLGPDLSVLDKASQLREKSKEYDLIIMHLHPEDIIPVIAFSCKNMPPVAIMNNGDHQFWVGASVCDILIQFREDYMHIDKERRGVYNHFFLPIPVSDTRITDTDTYLNARREIGIKDDEILLLSAGTGYKYIPNGEYNFFKSTFEVLEKNNNAKLFIAGISESSELAKKYPHERVKYLGTVTDLYKYEDACDICLEGFPLGGATAMLQCALKGKHIHLIYNPTLTHEFIPKDIFYFPENENVWQRELNRLIADKEYRTGINNKQLHYLQTHYNRAAWKNKVRALYSSLVAREHSIYKNDKSPHYITRNEYYLFYIGFGLMGTNHFLYCYHLPILSKVRHLSYLLNKPVGVQVGKRALLKFIFS